MTARERAEAYEADANNSHLFTHEQRLIDAVLSVGARIAELTEELRRQKRVTLAKFGPG